jgi:non-ribosomal peptide synthetase component F
VGVISNACHDNIVELLPRLEIAEKWGVVPSISLFNVYGVTEACVYQTIHRVTFPLTKKVRLSSLVPLVVSGGFLCIKLQLHHVCSLFNIFLSKVNNIGYPLDNIKIVILPFEGVEDDREDKLDVTTGEVCIIGPQVGEGYLNRPEMTSSRFVKSSDGERMYRTGDIGTIIADGNQ